MLGNGKLVAHSKHRMHFNKTSWLDIQAGIAGFDHYLKFELVDRKQSVKAEYDTKLTKKNIDGGILIKLTINKKKSFYLTYKDGTLYDLKQKKPWHPAERLIMPSPTVENIFTKTIPKDFQPFSPAEPENMNILMALHNLVHERLFPKELMSISEFTNQSRSSRDLKSRSSFTSKSRFKNDKAEDWQDTVNKNATTGTIIGSVIGVVVGGASGAAVGGAIGGGIGGAIGLGQVVNRALNTEGPTNDKTNSDIQLNYSQL